MLFLKLPQHLHLLPLLARRLAHLLLPLVIHHFLHHAPRLAVQIPELRVLGRDLRGVDFVGRVADHRVPPFHFVALVEVDADFFARGHGFERPGAFVRVDGFGEVALGGGRSAAS